MTEAKLYNLPTKDQLKSALDIKNVHEIPVIKKVVINIGVGALDKEQRQQQAEQVSQIAGQKLAPTKASRSVAGFKIRAGQLVGYRATLRGKKMWLFLNKLINVALPRTRDFRGLKKSGITDSGNFNIGIRDLGIFPEVKPDANRTGSLQICITSTARNKEEATNYYKLLGFPIEKE